MSWTNKPTKFAKTVEKDLLSRAKRVGLLILRQLITVSPRDVGRFVSNWVVGLGSRNSRTVSFIDRSGQSALKAGEATLKRAKLFRNIFISNNLPYARRLNDGWSQQAPRNFVQRSIKRAIK